MSIEIMNQVWQYSQSTGRARLVLLAIADHQGELGAWPSIATLAKMTNSSERSIKRDIQELIELGELRVELQNAPTRGQYKTNLYWVTISGVTKSASGVTESSSGVTNRAIRGDTVGTQNLNLTLKETLSKPRAFPMPNDWYPSNELLEMFKDKWPNLITDKDFHIEQFRLYWLASGKPMKDWGLTFQKWMNTEQQRSKKSTKQTDYDELEAWARDEDRKRGNL